MQPQPKHLSPWIAWSLLALVIGIAAFFVWNYYNDATAAWDNSVFSSLPTKHKTTTTTTPATSTTTTSTSTTANWKTYTSTTNKFSFKYPTDWNVTNSTDSSGNVIFNAQSNSAVKGDGVFKVEISPLTITDFINNTFINAYANGGANDTWNAFVVSDAQKYSVTGKKVVRTSKDNTQSYTIYVLTNPNTQKTTRIDGETTQKDVPENKMNAAIITQISATFQFTQ